MLTTLLLTVHLYLNFPRPDETVRGYGAGDITWQLIEMEGAPFPAPATLRFPRRGQIAGNGPCNSYRATMNVPYPWFGIGPIAATRRACPDLATELNYFDALQRTTLSEVFGDTLILSDDDGPLLVFKSAE